MNNVVIHIRPTITWLDHLFVAATVGTLSPVMEGIVSTTMSAHLEHITASNNVSILLVGSDVIATLDSNSILIRELAQVSLFIVSVNLTHFNCIMIFRY